MVIGERIKAFREAKKLSQGDIEKRTGLLRPYISRIENSHTLPSIETLEKFTRALGVPLYQMFYEGEKPPKPLKIPKGKDGNGSAWGGSGKDARMLWQFQRHLSRMHENDRKLLLFMAQQMVRRTSRRGKR